MMEPLIASRRTQNNGMCFREGEIVLTPIYTAARDPAGRCPRVDRGEIPSSDRTWSVDNSIALVDGRRQDWNRGNETSMLAEGANATLVVTVAEDNRECLKERESGHSGVTSRAVH